MSRTARFDCFEFDLGSGQLYKRGTRLPLRDQSARVLAALVECPGQVVTREELRSRLWPDEVFIDFDNSLNTAVARLREALNDSADHPRFVETLPKHGYRFVAPVTSVDATAAVPARRARLLVLPFVNLTGEGAHDHLADALTDDVITALAALPSDSLAVIARTTAMYYKGSRKDVARIGREVRVDYIVEGALRPAGESISINVQLIRVSDQTHVWARRCDTTIAEVFNVTHAVVQAVATALDLRAVPPGDVPPSGRAGRMRVVDPVAYNEYVQGLYHLDRFNLAVEGFTKAPALFESAIARDPGFALAHEAMAHVYWLLGYAGMMAPKDAFSAGILHAARALEIDNTRAETHALVAQYRKQLDYDWPAIEREMGRALELNVSSSLVCTLNAVGWLMPQGKIRESIVELERALEWDPLSYEVRYWLGVMFMLAREWDRALTEGQLLIEMQPEGAFGPWMLGCCLRGNGDVPGALEQTRKAVELSRGEPMMLGWLGLTLGSAGMSDEAHVVLDRLHAMMRTRYVPPSSIAWTYLGLRDLNRAFEWMDHAVEARDQLMMPIKSYAFFDPIRTDPRLAALVRKMNL